MMLIVTAVALLSGIFLPVAERAQAQGTLPQELPPVSVFFQEGTEMSPLPLESSDEFQAVSIPNGFIRDGLRGRNILPVGHTYWKSVGTWYTQPLKQKINLGGRAEVTIFAHKPESDGGSPNSDFRFEIMRGNEVLLDIYVGGIRITEGQDIKVTGAASFPPANDTAIEPGETLALRITARCNGYGAALRYGSTSYPSGLSFGSNALQIHSTRMERRHIVLEYKDAFMVPWTKIHTQVFVDGFEIQNDDVTTMMNSLNSTRELHWERESSYGDHELKISIGYNPEQNISIQSFHEIKQNKKAFFSLNNLGNIVSNLWGFIVFIIIVIVAWSIYLRRKSRIWQIRFRKLPPEIRAKDKAARKEAWKKAHDKKKDRWKEERKKRILKDEIDQDELEDEEFRLFKKKKKRTGPSQMIDSDPFEDDGELEDMEL